MMPPEDCRTCLQERQGRIWLKTPASHCAIRGAENLRIARLQDLKSGPDRADRGARLNPERECFARASAAALSPVEEKRWLSEPSNPQDLERDGSWVDVDRELRETRVIRPDGGVDLQREGE